MPQIRVYSVSHSDETSQVGVDREMFDSIKDAAAKVLAIIQKMEDAPDLLGGGNEEDRFLEISFDPPTDIIVEKGRGMRQCSRLHERLQQYFWSHLRSRHSTS